MKLINKLSVTLLLVIVCLVNYGLTRKSHRNVRKMSNKLTKVKRTNLHKGKVFRKIKKTKPSMRLDPVSSTPATNNNDPNNKALIDAKKDAKNNDNNNLTPNGNVAPNNPYSANNGNVNPSNPAEGKLDPNSPFNANKNNNNNNVTTNTQPNGTANPTQANANVAGNAVNGKAETVSPAPNQSAAPNYQIVNEGTPVDYTKISNCFIDTKYQKYEHEEREDELNTCTLKFLLKEAQFNEGISKDCLERLGKVNRKQTMILFTKIATEGTSFSRLAQLKEQFNNCAEIAGQINDNVQNNFYNIQNATKQYTKFQRKFLKKLKRRRRKL